MPYVFLRTNNPEVFEVPSGTPLYKWLRWSLLSKTGPKHTDKCCIDLDGDSYSYGKNLRKLLSERVYFDYVLIELDVDKKVIEIPRVHGHERFFRSEKELCVKLLRDLNVQRFVIKNKFSDIEERRKSIRRDLSSSEKIVDIKRNAIQKMSQNPASALKIGPLETFIEKEMVKQELMLSELDKLAIEENELNQRTAEKMTDLDRESDMYSFQSTLLFRISCFSSLWGDYKPDLWTTASECLMSDYSFVQEGKIVEFVLNTSSVDGTTFTTFTTPTTSTTSTSPTTPSNTIPHQNLWYALHQQIKLELSEWEIAEANAPH
jgi:hypothetical protein